MCTNSPLHFSQRSFIKPAELFLYVFLIIASERSRMAYLTFLCPSGNNTINHLWLLLFQADICFRVSHWFSGLCLLPSPIHTYKHTHTGTHTHTPPSQVELRTIDFLLELMLTIVLQVIFLLILWQPLDMFHLLLFHIILITH